MSLGTPKCQKSGCKNDAKEGSNYCYLHDNSYYTHKSHRSTYSGNSGGSGSSSNRSSGSSGNTSYSGSGSRAGVSGSGSSSEDTYDKGYEDVYEDGDYDIDRYNRDSDYANGVDDAEEDMEEEGEDW